MLKYLQRQTDIVFAKKKMQMDGIGGMNISGIRIQAGFYDYNTIKNTQIQEESVPNAIDTAGGRYPCG